MVSPKLPFLILHQVLKAAVLFSLKPSVTTRLQEILLKENLGNGAISLATIYEEATWRLICVLRPENIQPPPLLTAAARHAVEALQRQGKVRHR